MIKDAPILASVLASLQDNCLSYEKKEGNMFNKEIACANYI